MGKSGPPPTPTAILEKRGSWRSKTREGEIRTEVITPKKPVLVELDPVASVVWDDLIPKLETLDLLSEIDVFLLQRYCILYSQFHKAYFTIHRDHKGKQSYTTTDKLGNVTHKIYPELAIMTTLSKLLKDIEVQFGMTPSSRTAIRTNKHLESLEPKLDSEKEIDKSQFFND